LHAGHATAEGTARFAARFPGHQSHQFYRQAQQLTVSSLGLGSYLGNLDDATDRGYMEAARAALQSGINFIDTSLNYRHQRSERNLGDAIGAAIAAGEIARDEFVICTKAGYLVPDAVPFRLLQAADIVGNMNSMAPAFLRDQLERSRANLGLETIDVFYLHNPETQLQYIARDEFLRRSRAAFEALEALCGEGQICSYGTATWSGYRTANAGEGLSLVELERCARDVAGNSHRFRFIQLPLNMAMPEGASLFRENIGGRTLTVLDAAQELGITVVASASLLQAKLAHGLPADVAVRLPEASTDALRAIQFARSVRGVAVALVGMSSASHVRENLGVAGFAPSELEGWFRART
jgi:aryl-alcohol dehydrogenase-like predicted oxidoreductase